MQLLMDDHDKHEDFSEITCLKKGEIKIEQSEDEEAMKGLAHLKEAEEHENDIIKQIEKKIQEEDDQFEFDMSKYAEGDGMKGVDMED